MKESLACVCQRAESYKFLSECYYLPDDGFFQKVIDAAQTDLFFSELAGCISGLELESLKIDYTRLFIGPFKLLAPPYGSVYLEDNRIMGDSTVDVRNCYENEGLDIVIKDAPDHIAMELEFMYYLAVKQIEAVKDANLEILQSCQQKQYSFLRTHLSRWLPAFAENVQKNAQTKFYRKLAQLTDVFIQKDLDVCASFDALQSSR